MWWDGSYHPCFAAEELEKIREPKWSPADYSRQRAGPMPAAFRPVFPPTSHYVHGEGVRGGGSFSDRQSFAKDNRPPVSPACQAWPSLSIDSETVDISALWPAPGGTGALPSHSSPRGLLSSAPAKGTAIWVAATHASFGAVHAKD